MQSTTFIQTAEVKNQYDGKFAHIDEFNRKFEARLSQRNPLAMSIVNGTIELKPRVTKRFTIYEHAKMILTSFLLAIQIMLTVDPETINYGMANFTKPQYDTVYAILSEQEGKTQEQRIEELWKHINTRRRPQPPPSPITTRNDEDGDDDDSDDNENGNENDTSTASVHYPGDRITAADLDKIVKHLVSLETEAHKAKRMDDDQFTTNEYVEYGIIKFKSNDDRKEFIKTGIIPTRFITQAMKDIDQTIQETVSSKVLRDKRHIRANGKQKTGLEIYQALQTPHDNVIMNCLYLYKKIDDLTSEEARVPASYFQKLVLLRQRLDDEMSNLNSKLEKYEILTMLDTVNKFAQTTEGQAAKQALLQRDFKLFNDVEEYKNLLMQITMTKSNAKPKRIATNQTNNERTNRHGRKIKCKACERNHYLNECTNEAKKAELKARDPETYNKFINFPKCKYGANCKNKATCKYDHSEKHTRSNQTNIMVGHTRAVKANQVKPKSESQEKWIMDSGSGGHIKTNKRNVDNIRNEEYVLETQSGSIKTKEVADAGQLKDVIINEAGDVCILSLIKWLRNNPDKVTLTTPTNAYAVPLAQVQHIIEQAKVMANINADDMFELSDSFLEEQGIKVHNVKPQHLEKLVHDRIGHASPETMLLMNKHGLLDLNNQAIRKLRHKPCKGCQENAKNKIHSKHPKRDATERNVRRRNTIGHFHGDVAKLPSNNDSQYTAMHVFVDHKSRYIHTVFDNNMKPTAAQAIANLNKIKGIVNAYGHKFQSLRYDKESGYIADATKQWYNKQDPKIKLGISRASEQNISEPKIGILRDRANKMMNARDLPVFYAPYAFRYACQLTNLLPSDVLHGRTPYQEYHNESPYNNLARARVFGSVAYYKRPELTKHDKAEPCIFLGFDDIKSRNYWIYSTKTKRIITVNDAVFVETELPSNWYQNLLDGNSLTYQGTNQHDDTPTPSNLPLNDDEDEQLPEMTSDSESEDDEEEDDQNPNENQLPGRLSDSNSSGDEEDHEEPEPNDMEPVEQAQSPKQTRSGKNYQTIPIIKLMATKIKPHRTMIRAMYPKKHDITIPKTRKEMLVHKYASEFKIAEEIELATIKEKGTIEYVDDSPKIQHKLKTRMVYDIKSDNDGNVLKFKARLVVLGYQQRENEYHEKYAPVSQWATILILMLVGWYYGMQIFCMDFKGAYLHANRPTDIPIYLKNIGHTKNPDGKVPLLVKSLYGTIDAGNLWRKEVHELLTDLGYRQSKNDPCLYIKRDKNITTYIATWVDDLIIATNDPNPETIKESAIKRGYDISLFEPIDKYLGVQWNVSDTEFKFNQHEYIDSLLAQTNMTDCKGVRTPMADKPSYKDTPTGKYQTIEMQYMNGEISEKEATKKRNEVFEEIRYMKNVPYRNVLGALSHLARRSRPDIQFAVFYHSRYQNDPGYLHWKGLKRILRYLKHTRNLYTTATRDAPWLYITCDSDLGGDEDESKSTSGLSIKMKEVPIVSKSKIQRMTAKSSTEAELIAMVEAVEESIWIKNLLLDFNIDITPVIHCDNQPAIDTIKNHKLVKGNKHIARRYHFVKGYYEQNLIDLQYIPTKQNTADMFTKALTAPLFEYHLKNLYNAKL